MVIILIGFVFGSFLNSIIYRIENKVSFSGRSFCPNCKKQIVWYDNVPLLSYLLLAGKCRVCKKPIPIEYPIIELLTAIVFLLIGVFSEPGIVISEWLDTIYNLQFTIYSESITGAGPFPLLAIVSLILLLATCFLLLAVAIYDAKTKYVLTYYAYVALILGVFYNLTEYIRLENTLNPIDLFNYYLPFVLSAILPAGLFWLVSWFSKEKAMGAGDTDIALGIGFLVGWPNIIPTYYFAFVVGAIWGIYLLATKKAKMKSEVPFGPFLILGAFFSLLFGEQLIAWYGRIILGI